jgi:hypothetical protein
VGGGEEGGAQSADDPIDGQSQDQTEAGERVEDSQRQDDAEHGGADARSGRRFGGADPAPGQMGRAAFPPHDRPADR